LSYYDEDTTSYYQADTELELGTKPDGTTLRVPASAFDRHTQLIGTTGGGKSYCMQQIFQELALKTDSALVVFDPTGNLYGRLKRWAYTEHLDHRLVFIDPSEDRLICGLNPIKPWPANHGLQAALAWETLRRAMDAADFAHAPLLEQWMWNVLYALISTGFTMHEAANLLRFEDQGFRRAVINRLPQGDARHDFGVLDSLVNQPQVGQALKEWQTQQGSAYRRIIHYSHNERLSLMLGTTQRVVDWADVIDQRKLVLVNLNPQAGDYPILGDDHVRMLGLQLISDLIQECRRRTATSEREKVPCYLFVDECQRFVSPNLERILAEMRQFNLRLLLAHRSPSELLGENDDNGRLMHLVASCTQLKIVFGGLDWKDTEPVAWTLYAHHINLEEVKDEIQTWAQLHRVEEFDDVTTVEGGSEGVSSGKVESDGTTYIPADGLLDFGDNKEVASNFGKAASESLQKVRNWSTIIKRIRQVVPGDPFQQVTGRQFYSIDEQMHKATSHIIKQPEQHAIIAVGKDVPINFRVFDLYEPAITHKQALGLDLEVMRTLPHYTEPHLIEEEIRDRVAGLLEHQQPKLGGGLRPEDRTKKKKR
jgi:hypothetical protein